jgi:hypothetical protein
VMALAVLRRFLSSPSHRPHVPVDIVVLKKEKVPCPPNSPPPLTQFRRRDFEFCGAIK